VTQKATAELQGAVRQLRVGSDVSIGETIKTDGSGLVQLLFGDNSKLVVGPNSALDIEDYLIRDNNSAGKFAINTLSGTFRFVTGTAPHNSYLIKTPTGTIGVRGTGLEWAIIAARIPDIIPPAQISTLVVLLDGGIRICNLGGQCADITDICDFGAFNSGGAIGIDNTRESRSALRGLFPIALNQSRLQFPFWISATQQCFTPPPNTAGAPPALGTASNVTTPGETRTTTTTVATTTGCGSYPYCG
jgi:hypothetical protein